jgi:hypothetical protein
VDKIRLGLAFFIPRYAFLRVLRLSLRLRLLLLRRISVARIASVLLLGAATAFQSARVKLDKSE